MARYADAITWITNNDDTDWLDGEEGTAAGQESVTAALVADLFGKTDKQVRADLLAERKNQAHKTRRAVAQRLRGNEYK